MPPPPSLTRQKRPAKVLDEDVYADAVSHIIARDFFPGLLETKAQKEYMDALDSNNRDWIREAGRNLTQVMTPGPDSRRRAGRGTGFNPRGSTAAGDTPRNFAGGTPGRTPLDSNHFAPESEEKDGVDVNLSLGAFQTKYTSEDNESFNALLDKQNEKRAAKYGFFHHGNKIPTARQIAWREKEQKRTENSESSSTALIRKEDTGETSLAVAAARPSQDLDLRPASVNSFPNRQGPRNHLMFGPYGVEDLVMTRAQQAEFVSVAPPKAVNYPGTRFSDGHSEADKVIPPSPSLSAIDAAITGRPQTTESEPGYSGTETPRVNGYAFVDAEPTISQLGVSVTDEEADAAEKEAAKKFLPKLNDDGISLFNIKERSKREDLHHRLVEKADASRRKGGRLEQLRHLGITPGRTPTPKFTSGANIRKGGGMTPAAKFLADRLSTPRNSGMFKPSGDKSSWTPTPRTRRAL